MLLYVLQLTQCARLKNYAPISVYTADDCQNNIHKLRSNTTGAMCNMLVNVI